MKNRLANWGNYPVILANEVPFENVGQAKNFVLGHENVIGRGNGRCYGDASLAENAISTLNFDKILAFDETTGTFNCETGITMDVILEIIVPKGWFLPVTPGTKFITIGGAVASNIHGKNHHIDGTFGNHVIDMDIMISSGEIITCSPEINNDLFNATLGGMGLTGLILRVKFKLKKIETSFIKQKQIKAKNLTEILELFEEYKDYPYSMAWIDCLKQGKNYGRSIMMAGENAISSDLNDKQKRNPLRVHSKRHLVFPVNIPSFILNHYTIKAFNFAYYHKNLSKEINNTIAYDQFFYPLDTILHWNRGYGKKGVIQYQFVLPKESSHKGLVDILTRINKKGMGSFLAVLKLFGAQTSLISFPMEGYTLALDFPIRDRLFEFLDELDKMVLDYGGRIYLTKDARMKSDMFWKGYPNAGKFLEIVKKYNPEYKFRSLLSDRLKITTEP
jgi:FAD/FMN-containing dehydrogenase